MSKKETSKQDEKSLTEWQKRNLEYLKRREENQKDRLNAEAKIKSIANRKGKEVSDSDSQKSKKGTSKSKKKKFSPLGFIKGFMLIIFLWSLAMISPLNKIHNIRITGLTNITTSEVLAASKISKETYTSDLIFKRNTFTRNIKQNLPWVEKADLVYTFPLDFKLDVEEYNVVAYKESKNAYYPVLENGTVIKKATTDIKSDLMIMEINDDKIIQKTLEAIRDVSPFFISQIKSISKIESKSIRDLLLIETNTNHSIRVPLSQLKNKLGYYHKLEDSLPENSIIDMEVGIFATFPEIEVMIDEVKSPTTTENISSTVSELTESSTLTETTGNAVEKNENA